MALPRHQRLCALLRSAGFVVLHLVTYTANLLVMWVCYTTRHHRYLAVLVPVHLIIGGLCAYTTVIHVVSWPTCRCRCARKNLLAPVKLVLAIVVLGFMQFVQVKLALEDYAKAQRARGNEFEVPGATPTRFYCKATDGILESTAFAFVVLYALLKYHMFDKEFPHGRFEGWHWLLLYCSICVNFVSIGLALMEVDHRTSLSVQRVLKKNRLASFRHLMFRSCEVALRLMSVGLFCSYLRVFQKTWWSAFVLVGVDYAIGVLLLVCLGGAYSGRLAAVLLGVPLFIANVMQFVDIPGMSLPARRISNVVVPFRTMELTAMLLFVAYDSHMITVATDGGAIASKTLVGYLVYDRTSWLLAWILVGVLYYTMLLTHALSIRPDVDLHSTIAYGDFSGLRSLLRNPDLVLDIDRYGPEGRTPLHLAALQGDVECVKLLLQERASIAARTSDGSQDTALHLAARSRVPAVVAELCRHDGQRASFVNAANSHGDTALHVAARRHNKPAIIVLLSCPQVDTTLTNLKDKTPAECVPSEKFAFDWTSKESVISDLFRDVEQGRPVYSCGSASHARSSSSSSAVELTAVAPSNPKSFQQNSFQSCVSDPSSPKPGGNVVLVSSIPRDQEEAYMRRSTGLSPHRTASFSTDMRRTSPPVSSRRDISSFMMSAGMGTLSRAFLSSINEADDDGSNPPVSASFDDFIEERVLGQGSFGKVTLVRHKATGERYAMKFMDKRVFRAQRVTAKADTEQFILKTTRHKFIVGLFYAFQGSSFWVLIMEYCPHGDLQDVLVLQGKPGLALADAARLSAEVLLAIEHLHSQRVIFRDIKLENVVISADYRARLTDFGLAKKLPTDVDAQTMCGSYGYAAPEIMTSTNRYTFAVDLYSFGVLLYMLLSGGDTPKFKPNQRVPPMKHHKLRRELRDCDNDPPGEWATAPVCAMPLLLDLTSENVKDRGTCASIKQREFFKLQLRDGVDALLTDTGPFPPVSGKRQPPAARTPRSASSSSPGHGREPADAQGRSHAKTTPRTTPKTTPRAKPTKGRERPS